MPTSVADKRAAFRRLHEAGCFVLPNPWDLGSGVLLTARAEGFIRGAPDLDEVIRRLKAYSAAGADCLYAPGIREESQIRAVVQAVAPKPVNLLTTGVPVATAESLGVRRISVGGALAGVAYGTFYTAAQEIAEKGTFGGLASASGA